MKNPRASDRGVEGLILEHCFRRSEGFRLNLNKLVMANRPSTNPENNINSPARGEEVLETILALGGF